MNKIPYFTAQNTLNEILGDSTLHPCFKTFFDDYLIDLYPEEVRDNTLKAAEQIIGMTPWEEDFSVITDQLLAAANQAYELMVTGSRECIPLWLQGKEDQEWSFPDPAVQGKEKVFLIAPNMLHPDYSRELYDSDQKRPAVIIVPGGGYENVCYANEGTPIQNFMDQNGYRSFILNYRVAPNRYPAPQLDLALAVRYVRHFAEWYQIDPQQIMVMGFSAGGHLSASLGALYPEIEQILTHEIRRSGISEKIYDLSISIRPDALCLGYPVISFLKEQHEGSFLCLTGGEEGLRRELSIEHCMHGKFPKTFVWACEDDGLVPASNAIRLAEAAENHNVPCQLAVFGEGGHGCGLAETKEAHTWTSLMLRFFQSETRSS